MLIMSQINYIKDLSNCGYWISETSEKTGSDPKTIRKYLTQEDFSPAPPVIKENPSRWILSSRSSMSGLKMIKNIGANSITQPSVFTNGWWKNTATTETTVFFSVISRNATPGRRKRRIWNWYGIPARLRWISGRPTSMKPENSAEINTLRYPSPIAMTAIAKSSVVRQQNASARAFWISLNL